MLEIGSSTRVREVCENLASRLKLGSWDGCSLFIKIADKVLVGRNHRLGDVGSCEDGLGVGVRLICETPTLVFLTLEDTLWKKFLICQSS